MANVCAVPPAYAGSHSCKAVEECAAGVLRSLGEGGHASSLRSRVGYYGGVGSAGSAEDTKGTTAARPPQ
jgi:hypothetical protein